jgi:hypothetical protein
MANAEDKRRSKMNVLVNGMEKWKNISILF